jgi:hypothetical protein
MLASVAHATRWNMKLNTIWHGVYRACNALDAMQHLRPTDCIYINTLNDMTSPTLSWTVLLSLSLVIVLTPWWDVSCQIFSELLLLE